MRIATVVLGVLVLASAAAAMPPVLLQDTIIRPTRHSQNWVPSSVYPVLAFTADGPDATIIFEAQTHSTETSSWLQQAIDNVAVVTRAVYDANLLARNQSDLGNYFWLQIEPSYPIFFFDHRAVSPADFKLFEPFETGVPAAWDLTDGGYWVDPNNFAFNETSAPNNDFVDPSNTSGGSLGLGAPADPPGTASTRIMVGELEKGTQYVVAFWWNAQNDNIDENGEPNPNGDLFVTVEGSEVLGVETSTWSGIKTLYRH